MNTTANIPAAVAAAITAAGAATDQYIAQHGDRDACGFAAVKVFVKGSTRIGRELLKNGFSKSYTGGLQYWNPSRRGVQSISALEAGADAAAEVLRRELAVDARSWSRMD